MRLKPIVLALAGFTIIFEFILGDYSRADSDLQSFYTDMLSADFASAGASIDEAIRLWPSNGRYYDWRGYLASQNLPPICFRPGGQIRSALTVGTEAAIRDYEHALELNRWDVIARHNMAWLEHLQGNNRDAGENWKAATELDPANPVFHLSYGMFLEEVRQTETAKAEYEAAISISPSILDSPFFARYQTRSNAAAESVIVDVTAELERRLRNAPSDPIVEAKLGKLYLFQQKRSQAATLLQEASRQLPGLSLVWVNLGETYEQMGRLADATDCYKKAEFDGSSYLPFFRLAELELASGDENDAADNFKQAILRWQRTIPAMASHNNRIYEGPPQVIDDLLPTTLVWYTTPCIASDAWKGLSEIDRGKSEYAARSETCKQIPSPHHF